MTDGRRRPPTPDPVGELLARGRDHEAAALGAATAAERSGGGTMDPLHQLDELGPLLAGVAAGIRPDQLDNPTPCARFSVRGVLEHMVGGATTFAAGFRGLAEAPAPPAGEPVEAFGAALGDLGAAMHEPGALDREIQAPFGAMPGEAFARYVVLDGLVHGWDLAVATGQPYDPPAPLVQAATTFAESTVGPLRDGDTFADPVEPPAAATPIERLAAYTGRRISGAPR